MGKKHKVVYPWPRYGKTKAMVDIINELNAEMRKAFTIDIGIAKESSFTFNDKPYKGFVNYMTDSHVDDLFDAFWALPRNPYKKPEIKDAEVLDVRSERDETPKLEAP